MLSRQSSSTAGSAPGTPPGLLSHPLTDLHPSWTSKDSKPQACSGWDSSDEEGIPAPLAPVMQSADPLGPEQILTAGLAEALGPMAGHGQQALPAAISISPRGPMLEVMWEQAAAAEAAMAVAQLAPGGAELTGAPMQPSVGAALDVGQIAACRPARNGSAEALTPGQQVVCRDLAPGQQASQHAIQEVSRSPHVLAPHTFSGARAEPELPCSRPRRSFLQWLAGTQLHAGVALLSVFIRRNSRCAVQSQAHSSFLCMTYIMIGCCRWLLLDHRRSQRLTT